MASIWKKKRRMPLDDLHLLVLGIWRKVPHVAIGSLKLTCQLYVLFAGSHLQVAISHEPEAIAVAAEGLSHARHKADCASESRNAEVLGNLASGVLQCSATPGWSDKPQG